MAGYIGNFPTPVPLTGADLTDGIITSAKIADGTIVGADINSTFDLTGKTVTGAGGTNTPAFHVFESSGQTVTTNTYTKCTLDEELYDTNSNFASSRFTPTVAGKYFIYGNIHLDASSYPSHFETSIYKNVSIIATNFTGTNSASYGNNLVQTTVDMNGSSDYVELYGKIIQASTCTFLGGVQNKFFGGYKILT
jgi:hypothetical protein